VVIPRAARVSVPFARASAGSPISDDLTCLGGTADPGLSSMGEFPFLVLGISPILFGMVRRRRHPEVVTRFSQSYPCSGGAPSAVRGRVESCGRRISWDPIGFRDRWCMSVSSNIRLSSLTLIVALVRWSFRALAL
jgi:hypothetical protein